MLTTVISLSTSTPALNSSQLLSTTASNFLHASTSTLDLLNLNDSNATNISDYVAPVFPSYIRTTSVVFCIIIMCLGVIGNIMVPIVIFKTKDMRNSTNIFLVNLSVADLMVLLVCTPTVLVEVNSKPETWVLGREMCKAVPFVELTVAHASVLTILAISFERYYAICKPLKAGYICTKTRASLICLLAWFIAAVFTSPILAITQYGAEKYIDGTIVFACFSLAEDLLPCIFFVGSIFLFFICPLCILINLYTLIAKTLMEHPTTLLNGKGNNNIPSNNVVKYRKQVILMLGTVVVAFFICLLPFRALTLWIIIAPSNWNLLSFGFENYYIILYFSRIMFHINSAVNPILYNIMSSKFRGGFLKICGILSIRKHLRRKNVSRKNTNSSSAQTISHPTSDSFLNKRNYSRQSSSSKNAKEFPNFRESTKTNDQKSAYVRAPLDIINSITEQKMPNNEELLGGKEIYV